MEINTNISAGVVNGAIAPKRAAVLKPRSDRVTFDDSAALNSSLENIPDTRAAAVQRARDLIGDVTYPPEETIRKLSLLLAIKLDSSES
jgi:hypothetical protein